MKKRIMLFFVGLSVLIFMFACSDMNTNIPSETTEVTTGTTEAVVLDLKVPLGFGGDYSTVTGILRGEETQNQYKEKTFDMSIEKEYYSVTETHVKEVYAIAKVEINEPYFTSWELILKCYDEKGVLIAERVNNISIDQGAKEFSINSDKLNNGTTTYLEYFDENIAYIELKNDAFDPSFKVTFEKPCEIEKIIIIKAANDRYGYPVSGCIYIEKEYDEDDTYEELEFNDIYPDLKEEVDNFISQHSGITYDDVLIDFILYVYAGDDQQILYVNHCVHPIE